MQSADTISTEEYREYLRTGRLPDRCALDGKASAGTSKYKNVRTEVDGKKYASKKEAKYAQEAKLRMRSGEIIGLAEQVPFQLPAGIKYIADFVEFKADGTFEVIDTKGVRTDTFKIKKKLMKEFNNIEVIEK